jgi:transcriptional antiterminator Rof (Rho-off)
MNKEDYKPISCDIYDEFINSIVLKRRVALTLSNERILEGFLADVYTREKQEYCIINGEEIRLDFVKKIVEIKNEE